MIAYRTAAGSTVEVSGAHSGIIDIVFDWFEEGVCCEARVYTDAPDRDEPRLRWSCECHGERWTALMEWDRVASFE